MKSLKGKFILAFDTICTGWNCILDENNQPYLYNSEKEAEADIMDENDFVVPAEEYIEGRKAIFTGNGGFVTGKKLKDNGHFDT